jgi:hypothetical protein
MRRRDLITFLGGAAAWPIAARGQQPERMRRIGILLPVGALGSDRKRWVAGVWLLAEIGHSEIQNRPLRS